MCISQSHTAKREPGLNSQPSACWSTLGCHLLNTVQDRNHAHGLVLRDLVSLQVTLAKCLPKAWERSVCLWNQRRDGCYSWNNFILSRNWAELMVHRKDFASLWDVSLFPPHRSMEVQPLILGFYVNCCLSTITRYISIFIMEPWWKSNFRKEEIQSVMFNIQGKYNKMILNGKIQVICDPSRPAIYIFKNIRLNILILKALKVSSRREH